MSRYIQLGPFDAEAFLIPPSGSANATTGTLLLLELFQLLHGDEEIGLDHIHADRAESKSLLKDGLRWRGRVLFSNTARNRKQISRQGMELLSRAAEASRPIIRLDWSEGFKVILEAPYWRHCFIRSPNPPPRQGPIFVELFVDLDPVPVNQQSRSTQFHQRRFGIQTMAEACMQYSHKTQEQSRLILVLEYIRRTKGTNMKAERRTVGWYCERYMELYPTNRGSDEAGTSSSHQEQTGSRSFYSALAMHLNSRTFCQDLVDHKRLMTEGNLARFRRESERIHDGISPEVRKRWGKWPGTKSSVLQSQNELIALDDSPSPPGVAENAHEPMDIDNVVFDQNYGDEYDQSIHDQTESNSLRATPSHPVVSQSLPSPIQPIPRPGSSSLSVEALRILPMMPRFLFDPPTLPADCQWVCPGCSVLFDLRGKLPRQVLEHLTPMEIEYLKRQGFTSKSHRLLCIFFVLVDVHYNQHLAELGIEADNQKGFRSLKSM